MIEKIAAQIKARLGAYSPETAVILGSGLGALGDLVENPVIIPYAEIEGFPQSTVSGHKGRLIIGRLEGKDILCMQGRVHLYEGSNDDAFGPRFPDMSNAYDAELRTRVRQIAARENIPLAEGVYLMVSGPTFDTPAEVRAYRILGADAVGMSTVPEVICAVHSGMRVLGFSVIVNLGCGLKQGALNHAETLREAEKASANLIRLVKTCIREI